MDEYIKKYITKERHDEQTNEITKYRKTETTK